MFVTWPKINWAGSMLVALPCTEPQSVQVNFNGRAEVGQDGLVFTPRGQRPLSVGAALENGKVPLEDQQLQLQYALRGVLRLRRSSSFMIGRQPSIAKKGRAASCSWDASRGLVRREPQRPAVVLSMWAEPHGVERGWLLGVAVPAPRGDVLRDGSQSKLVRLCCCEAPHRPLGLRVLLRKHLVDHSVDGLGLELRPPL